MPAEIDVRAVIDVLHAFGPGEAEPILARLAPLYDDAVVFTDPIQTVRGLDAFLQMNRRLIEEARVCNMVVTTWAQRERDVFLAWKMAYARKRGPLLQFDGTTLLTGDRGLIRQHRDHWDLAGNLLDAVPGIGRVYRRLVARLG